MKKTLGVMLLMWISAVPFQSPQSQQVFSGRISDSRCGASHQMMAAPRQLSDRDCVFECLKALAKYVLVDDKEQVLPIANQDLAGLPLFAGRPVRITGELKDGAIVGAKIEPVGPRR